MNKYASHGATFIAAALIGMAVGFGTAWRMGEPDRLAAREAQYFRVEMSERVGREDALLDKLNAAIAEIEKAVGPVDVLVKLNGEDGPVAMGELRPRPSKAD
ncbi:MAG: hypothetical protein A2Y86_05205 [Candidatus Aminicenantes bacterium RBG_13_62_12]|nr:MAG: hypothetical protein A2Y86_05205 [Candidatus Aminicenantes bacterium RBG_13_62_12]